MTDHIGCFPPIAGTRIRHLSRSWVLISFSWQPLSSDSRNANAIKWRMKFQIVFHPCTTPDVTGKTQMTLEKEVFQNFTTYATHAIFSTQIFIQYLFSNNRLSQFPFAFTSHFLASPWISLRPKTISGRHKQLSILIIAHFSSFLLTTVKYEKEIISSSDEKEEEERIMHSLRVRRKSWAQGFVDD